MILPCLMNFCLTRLCLYYRTTDSFFVAKGGLLTTYLAALAFWTNWKSELGAKSMATLSVSPRWSYPRRLVARWDHSRDHICECDAHALRVRASQQERLITPRWACEMKWVVWWRYLHGWQSDVWELGRVSIGRIMQPHRPWDVDVRKLFDVGIRLWCWE